jgi:hypothetical protein
MQSALRLASCLLLINAASAFGADAARNWQSGTLVETEKQQVLQGSTRNTSREVTAKNKNNKTDYSENSNSTTTDNYDNFQVYTIQGDNNTYVARERLLFPWSKPATVTVGAKLKFAVEKNTIYLIGDDGKQHKAGVSKISMNPAH